MPVKEVQADPSELEPLTAAEDGQAGSPPSPRTGPRGSSLTKNQQQGASTGPRRRLLALASAVLAPLLLYFVVKEGQMTGEQQGRASAIAVQPSAPTHKTKAAASVVKYEAQATSTASTPNTSERALDPAPAVAQETKRKPQLSPLYQMSEQDDVAEDLEDAADMEGAGESGEEKPFQKTLILTYAWGTLGGEMLDMFVRSLRWTGSDADVVIFTHDIDASDETRAFLEENRVEIQHVPAPLLSSSKTFREKLYMLARFVAWDDYLHRLPRQYTHVMTTDMDVFFQQDPGSCFPAEPMIQAFEENQAQLIEDCGVHKHWIADCPQARGRPGPEIWERIKSHGRICDGVIYGDIVSMTALLDTMREEMDQHLCNDQGMLNMLVWDDMLVTPSGESSPLVSRVHVFNAFLGPVKTTDVGFYRDEYGYALTNTGKRYCMMHQFKSDRNKQFVDHLWSLMSGDAPSSDVSGLSSAVPPPVNPAVKPRWSNVEFMHIEDTRFPDHLHPAVSRMRDKGMTWPELPADRDTWQGSEWGTTQVYRAAEAEQPSE